jgi:competence protein ComEC
MLVAACLALLAAPWAALSQCFGATAGAFGSVLAGSVHALARAPGAAVSAPALHPVWALALIGAVAAFPYAVRTGRGKVLVLLCAAAFSGRWAYLSAREAFAPARVDFLDIGQGDAAVLRLRGAVILIDAGPEPAGREGIVPWLRQAGIDRIDLAIVTHPDLDHYGGLAYVAAHTRIGAVAHPGLDADTQAWRNLKAMLAERGIPTLTAARGQALYAGGGDTLRVLSPEIPDKYADRNDNSVVTLLSTPRNRILFTGDLGPEAEARLMALEPRRLTGSILKVPHHGSDLSNPREFLEAVRPGVALLSAGRTNKFGHPGPATVSALRGLGAGLFHTARDGAVSWIDDGPAGGRWETFTSADTSLPILAPPRKPRKSRAAGFLGQGARE